jgi:LCP family protein required for cell wall assembly
MVLWIVGIAVLVVVLVAGGAYAWLSATLSKANNRPGVSAARLALQETVTTVPATTSSSPSVATTAPVPPPENPDTMNILLLGADKVAGIPEEFGRSDTMMLVHVDPGQGFVSILSFPRDLRVDLGDRGFQKLNAAYAFGGDALAIRTIRDLTGLQIDHYIKVGFEAFEKITTELGGVWLDVDRRYYYTIGVYEPIDLQPGYQRIAGLDALQYVRFRHDLDHDWARIQRQQRFLRAAKEQVFQWNMATRLPSAVSTLMEYVATEIGPNDALKLAWWTANLDMSRVKQVTMEGTDDAIDGTAFVLSTDKQIQAAIDDLLTPPVDVQTTDTTTGITTPDGPRDTKIDLSGIRVEVRYAGDRAELAGSVAGWLEQQGAQVVDVYQDQGGSTAASLVSYPAENPNTLVPEGGRVAVALGINNLVENDKEQNVVVRIGSDLVAPDPAATVTSVEAAQWRYLAGVARFAVEAPGWLPAGFDFVGSRVYDIPTDDGPRPALKVTYRLGRQDQYLGLMETTFVNAPAASPGEQVDASGTTFTVVTVGGQVERVWWRRGGVLYWVSNTLASALSRDQLLQVATSMTPAG